MNSNNQKGKGTKNKQWIVWVLSIFLVFLLLVGFLMITKISNTFTTIHDPLKRDVDQERQKDLKKLFKEHQALNILLLGVDERPSDKGRSDAIIFMSLNPQTDSLAMLSIPRDTYVNIPGHGKDKINHAYAFGDVHLSIQTIENALDLPIHFYAKVNMEGFKEGIDAIDGVTVDNDLEFTQGKHHFPKGKIQLNGEQALNYIRMRKDDPDGDLGRNRRQRQVIEAAMEEISSISSIPKIGSILNILGNNLKTDLTINRIQSLFFNYRNTRKNIITLEVKGQGKFIGPHWYYVVSDDELNRLHTEIKEHMKSGY